MIVKYYGCGHPADPEKGYAYINAAVLVFQQLGTETLSQNTSALEPGASIWLVPGTFDLEGDDLDVE